MPDKEVVYTFGQCVPGTHTLCMSNSLDLELQSGTVGQGQQARPKYRRWYMRSTVKEA